LTELQRTYGLGGLISPTNPNSGSGLDALVERALAGERTSLARAISLVENETPEAQLILERAYPRTGNAVRLGITGPPGAGKSTLVSRLAKRYREMGEQVAIVAVDPTSPFSGGALLGDRVRMSELAGDPGLFIRSMASRGSLGGLAVTTSEVCDLLEAAGFTRLLVETVGVGQSELEVAEAADCVIVVLVPESGDGVQAMKAGLMEIGDVFVLNKADRDGAERAAQEVSAVLALKKPAPGAWRPPVVLTAANSGRGVDDLVEQIARHLAYLNEQGLLRERRRRRLRARVTDLVRHMAVGRLRERVAEARWTEILASLEARRRTPHQAAALLWEEAWPEDARDPAAAAKERTK
jgi:LAO/AO transport system kinase